MPTTSNAEVDETRSARMSTRRDRLTAFTSLLRSVRQLEVENEQAQRTIVKKVKSRLCNECMDCPKRVLIINLHADTDDSRREECHLVPPKYTVGLFANRRSKTCTHSKSVARAREYHARLFRLWWGFRRELFTRRNLGLGRLQRQHRLVCDRPLHCYRQVHEDVRRARHALRGTRCH